MTFVKAHIFRPQTTTFGMTQASTVHHQEHQPPQPFELGRVVNRLPCDSARLAISPPYQPPPHPESRPRAPEWSETTAAKRTSPDPEYSARHFGFFSEFSGGMKVGFLIIRDANQGACESGAFADSECGA